MEGKEEDAEGQAGLLQREEHPVLHPKGLQQVHFGRAETDQNIVAGRVCRNDSARCKGAGQPRSHQIAEKAFERARNRPNREKVTVFHCLDVFVLGPIFAPKVNYA